MIQLSGLISGNRSGGYPSEDEEGMFFAAVLYYRSGVADERSVSRDSLNLLL